MVASGFRVVLTNCWEPSNRNTLYLSQWPVGGDHNRRSPPREEGDRERRAAAAGAGHRTKMVKERKEIDQQRKEESSPVRIVVSDLFVRLPHMDVITT